MFRMRARNDSLGKYRGKSRGKCRQSFRKRFFAEPLEDRRMLAELLTILVDEGGTFQTPDPVAYFDGVLFENPGANVADFFSQSSEGQFTWEPAVDNELGVNGIIGPLSVPGPKMDWDSGLTTSQEYVSIIRSESIAAARDAGFDFTAYDVNEDGLVTDDELSIMIVLDGQSSGAVRWHVPVDVGTHPSTGLPVQVVGTTASIGEFTKFDTTAHELAHLLGAKDLYGAPEGTCLSGQLTLMSCTGSDTTFDFDPWHKELLGWKQFPSFDLATPGSRILKSSTISPADSGFILYDSRSSLNDRLYVELRPSGTTYDQPSNVTEGVAVWYVRENPDGTLGTVNLGGTNQPGNFLLGSFGAGGRVTMLNARVGTTWQDGLYAMDWADGSPVDSVFQVLSRFDGADYEFIWGIQEDRLEQNDTFATATNLGSIDQSWSDLTIDVRNDNDYFRFTANDDGPLTVDIGFSHAFGNLNLEISNSAGTLLKASRSTANNEGLSIQAVSGETYFIRVYEQSGATHPNYRLNIDGPSIPEDRFEPNNTLATATNLASRDQTWNELTIHAHDDNDFFSYTAPATGPLTVDILFDSSEGDLDLELLNSAGTVLTQSTSESDNERVTWSAIAGETYILHAFGYFGSTQSEYTLSLNGPDPLLPDLLAFDFEVLGDAQVTPGETIEVFYDYDNTLGMGPVSGSAYDVGFYLSTDPDINPNDDFLLTFREGVDLVSHGFFNDKTDITLPPSSDAAWSVGGGDYYIGMYVDDTFNVAEVTETNNSKSQAISVTIMPCDFVGASGCDIADIDALYGGSDGAPAPLTDDLINQWLVDASDGANPLKPTSSTVFMRGDADLDGDVDSTDLGLLLNNFGGNTGLGWGAGNLNADSVVNSTDLGLLLNNFGFTSPIPVAAVSAAVPLAVSDARSAADISFAESDEEDEDALDVTGDGHVTPLDAVVVINALAAPLHAASGLAMSSLDPDWDVDVNGDGYVSPIDALRIVNRLNNPLRVQAAAQTAKPFVFDQRFDTNDDKLEKEPVIDGRLVEAVFQSDWDADFGSK